MHYLSMSNLSKQFSELQNETQSHKTVNTTSPKPKILDIKNENSNENEKTSTRWK